MTIKIYRNNIAIDTRYQVDCRQIFAFCIIFFKEFFMRHLITTGLLALCTNLEFCSYCQPILLPESLR